MVITVEQCIVVILTIFICIAGLTFNGMALFLFYRLKELRNAFGYMCASHVYANIGLATGFLLWGVPMTITKSELSQSDIGKVVAGFCILCWEVSLYSHLFMAFNRLCAIFWPVHYMVIYKTRTTFTFIAISWIMAILHVLPFSINGCGIHYVPDEFQWLYDETPCSQFVAHYLDFSWGSFGMVIIVIMDGLNIFRICSTWTAFSTATVTSRRKRREIILFGQAVCQNILFAIAQFLFHWSAVWVSGKLPLFFIITFYWGTIHAADGLILLLFNYGMHRKKL